MLEQGLTPDFPCRLILAVHLPVRLIVAMLVAPLARLGLALGLLAPLALAVPGSTFTGVTCGDDLGETCPRKPFPESSFTVVACTGEIFELLVLCPSDTANLHMLTRSLAFLHLKTTANWRTTLNIPFMVSGTLSPSVPSSQCQR